MSENRDVMQWPFVDFGFAERRTSAPMIHFGIPRSGSSTMRYVLKAGAYAAGYDAFHFLPEDQDLPTQTRVLMVETPIPPAYLMQTKAQCFTSVRDPIDTTLSFFFHRKRLAQERQEYEAVDDFERYVDGLPASYNVMARMFATMDEDYALESYGIFPDHLHDSAGFFKPIEDDDLFQMAKDVIDKRFQYIAQMADLECLILMMFMSLGVKEIPAYQLINISEYSLVKEDILKRVDYAQLVSKNQVDLKLLSYIQSKYQKKTDQMRKVFGQQLSTYMAITEKTANQCLKGRNVTFSNKGLSQGSQVAQGSLGITAQDLQDGVVIREIPKDLNAYIRASR